MYKALSSIEIYNLPDPDDSFKLFLGKINPSLVNCFKRKNKKMRNSQRCIWYDRELALLSRKKDRLYKIYVQKKTPKTKEKYHKLRNFYFHMVTQKKKEHMQSQFQKYQNNIRKTWQLMKNLLGKARNKFNSTSINYNGVLINKPVEIANSFNDHFSTIANKLIDKLPSSPNKFTDYLPPPNSSSMFMSLTNIIEIQRLINQLKPKLSAGIDLIPPIVLRHLPENVLHALTYIFNQSLCQGKFISIFKQAKIILVFKKGNPKNVLNYRPISLLSSLSKILEKIVYSRLHSFVNMNNSLSSQQFGFRHKHSTTHATTLLISNIVDAFEKKQLVLGIFLDISKAFDTIDHNILLHKLNNYGVRGVSLNWFKSYLSDRSQIVEYDGVSSSNQINIFCSVPQGSILAPLLFIIYVNDFTNCLQSSSNISFADDTNVFIVDNNLQALYEKGNSELENIDNWMVANKLSININKTNYILFQTPKSQASKVVSNLQLRLRNNVVEKVSSARFLGVIINENLSWKIHIDMIKHKMRAGLGAVMRIRSILSPKAMLSLYHSLLLSHVRYCITNWCFGNESKVQELQRICNKFIRLVFNLKRHDSVKMIMKQNGLLNIKQIYQVELAIFMYKTVKKSHPIALQNLFQSKPSRISTRSNSLYISPAYRLTVCQQSIKFSGPKIWSNLPSAIKNCKNLKSFSNKVKEHVLNTTEYEFK